MDKFKNRLLRVFFYGTNKIMRYLSIKHKLDKRVMFREHGNSSRLHSIVALYIVNHP